MTLRAASGRVPFVVSASGFTGTWSWDEVVLVAENVAQCIADSLDPRNHDEAI
jgi:hypothetical protein